MTIISELEDLIEAAEKRMKWSIEMASYGAPMDAGGIAAYKKAIAIIKKGRDELIENIKISDSAYNGEIPGHDIVYSVKIIIGGKE